MATKKVLCQYADKLAALLVSADKLRPLIGRRVVGVAFNGECEGAYTLNFDDGSAVSFSSLGDDMTITTVTLSDFQKRYVAPQSGTH